MNVKQTRHSAYVVYCIVKYISYNTSYFAVQNILTDTDVRDKDNKTPLHHACEGRDKEILVYLVEEINCNVGE